MILRRAPSFKPAAETPALSKDLFVLLVSFLLLATVYAWAIPYLQSSDELGHFEFVKRLVFDRTLPVITTSEYFAAEQHQPPAYYFLAALLGRALLAAPFGPTDGQMALIFYGARGLSIAFGLATVAGSYLLASHFFGPKRLLGALATVIVAFNPGFIAIMAAVTNDSMAAAVGVFVLLATVKAASSSQLSLGWLLLVGFVAGLAALTKENLLALLLPLAAALTLMARRSGSPRYPLMVLLAVGAPLLIISGWWYWRNWALYGDPLAWSLNALLSPGNIRQQAPAMTGFLSTIESVAQTYWVGFGRTHGVRAPMAVYLAIWTGCGTALFGLYRLLRRKPQASWLPQGWKLGLAFLAADVGLTLLADLSYDRSFIGAGAGRYFYPVAGAIALLLALGLSSAARARSSWPLVGFSSLLLGLAVVTPAVFLRPLQVTPPVATEVQLKTEARPVDAVFDQTMQLVGYRISSPVARPGDIIQVSLYWKALGRTTTIWTNYIHLIDSKDAIFGQYDSIPLKEGYPALFWKKGEVWRDDIQFTVEPRAPNGYYRLQVGLYSLQTGKGAPVSAQGRQWVGGLLMGGIRLVAPEAPVEAIKPLQVEFQESIRLTGWAYQDNRFVLYWQPSAPVTRTLTSFVHLLDANSRVVAQHDGWPDMGRMPTFVWLPGETVRDQHEFKAPPGSYTLEVGLYDSETLQPVPMITGGRSLLLGEVSVP